MAETSRTQAADSPPTVHFITRKWPPAVGGMETYSIRLCEALGDLAVVMPRYLPGRSDGTPPGVFALLGFGLKTAFWAASLPAGRHVVHIGDMASWPLAFAARLRDRERPIVISAHGTDVSYGLRASRKGRLYARYLRLGAWMLPGALVVANSQATAQCAGGYGFERLRVSPLATDMTEQTTNVAPDPFILFAGRLVERKGCAWFIRNVLPHLPEPLVLKVAGTVWSPAEEAALSDPRVEFIGPQDQTTLATLYARATCVVVPNIDVDTREFEGFGLVATEAAACGGVALAADHSGLREALVDGVTGFHIPPGDADAWITRITEVAGWDADTRQAFVNGAFAETETHYRWPRVAGDAIEAYHQVMADPRGTAA
ncbi:MAG: glycosyltransferase family 4 protein [Alphaproteobacteria bacterium]|nr:glycosyltransferase family 4 protein [Alphaproteobacteria bacterium]